MSSDKKAPASSSSTTHLIVGTFLDTTWRMFVPVLAFTLLGWLVDKLAHTRPAGILTGLVIGVIGSTFLTIRLYQTVTKMQKEQAKK